MIEPYLIELRLAREPGLDVAMRYPLAGGGKRIRPRLCLAAARAGGADPAIALPAAAAIELIHTFSLVHDDLPALDDDDERRGRPSLHVAHGEAVAILAGDGLLNAAYRLASERLEAPPEGAPPGHRRAGGGRCRDDRRPVPRRRGARARCRGARPAAPAQDGIADLGRRRVRAPRRRARRRRPAAVPGVRRGAGAPVPDRRRHPRRGHRRVGVRAQPRARRRAPPGRGDAGRDARAPRGCEGTTDELEAIVAEVADRAA